MFDSMFGVPRAIEIFPTYNGGKGYVYHLYNKSIDTTYRIVTLSLMNYLKWYGFFTIFYFDCDRLIDCLVD